MSGREVEAKILDFLTESYAQPDGHRWEESKTYFLPEKSGLLRLSQTDLGSGSTLFLYRASPWFIHWAPERFPAIAWAKTNDGSLQPGAAEQPEILARDLTRELAGLTFESQEKQERLARAIGEAVAVLLYPSRPEGIGVVTSHGCSRAFTRLPRNHRGNFVGAACFSKEGRLVEVRVFGT